MTLKLENVTPLMKRKAETIEQYIVFNRISKRLELIEVLVEQSKRLTNLSVRVSVEKIHEIQDADGTLVIKTNEYERVFDKNELVALDDFDRTLISVVKLVETVLDEL